MGLMEWEQTEQLTVMKMLQQVVLQQQMLTMRAGQGCLRRSQRCPWLWP